MTPDQRPETTGVDLDELADAACKRALPLTWEAEESADERGHGGECIYNAFEVCSSFRDGYKARAAEDEVELRTLRARVGELETWNANQAEQIRTLERTLDCEEGRACDAEARAESAEARVGELEAEVRRVRDLINVDRTGLAATLNHIRAIVGGYAWIPAGEWGSYDYTQRTADTLQVAVGNLIESVTSAIDRGLNASGKRADSAHRDGPSVPLGPTLGELEARAESAEARVQELEGRVGELEAKLELREEHYQDLLDGYVQLNNERNARITALESQLEAARAASEKLAFELEKLSGVKPAYDLLSDLIPYLRRKLLDDITPAIGEARVVSPMGLQLQSWFARVEAFEHGKPDPEMWKLRKELEAAREEQGLEAKVREVLDTRFKTLAVFPMRQLTSGLWHAEWRGRWRNQESVRPSPIRRASGKTLPALLRAILDVEKGGA